MKKQTLLFTLCILLVGVTAFAFGLSQGDQKKDAHAAGQFVKTRVADGSSSLTAMEFAPDGRLFFLEKAGRVRVVKNGSLLPTPFITLPNIETTGERGVIGIAFDPNFATNHYVYLHYTVNSPLHNRVSRFTANGDVADPATETPIIDMPLLSSTIHNGGAIHFGTDGKLYISVGDNAVGSNAQSMTTLMGKILRINADGTIPTDNPFYTTATGTNRAIWATGFRNPFTFAIQPGTGRLFVNDVGDNGDKRWEEVNDVLPGKNYGWPTAWGDLGTGGEKPIYTYQAEGCAATGGTFYNPSVVSFPSTYVGKYFFTDYCNGWIKTIDPTTKAVALFQDYPLVFPVDLKVGPDGALYVLTYSTSYDTGATTTGYIEKIAYTDSPEPSPCGLSGTPIPSTNGLKGEYFNNITLSGTPILTTVDSDISFGYGSGGGVDAFHPTVPTDGFSVRWTGFVEAKYTETYTFTTNSDDGVRLWVNGTQLVNNWTNHGSTENTGTISLVAGQKYAITMEYYDKDYDAIAELFWTSPSQPKQIIPTSNLFTSLGGTTPTPTPQSGTTPVGTITSPTEQAIYTAGQTINYSATGTDQEDGTLPASAFSWTIVFHHGTHTHPFVGPVAGQKSGSFTIPAVGEWASNVWYRVNLTVTDSSGLKHSSYVDIVPKKVKLTLATNPAGLQTTFDSVPDTSPYTQETVAGMKRTIGVTTPQTLNGKTYTFASWSDGGAASHEVTTPATDTTYTATFTEVVSPTPTSAPGTAGLTGRYYANQTLTGTPIIRVDPDISFGYGSGGGAGAFHPSIPANNFSVRWTGYVKANYSQTYTFTTNSDDGVRLWVNGTQLVNNWTNHGSTENSGTITLTAGQKYAITMEYYDNTYDAIAELYWSSPSQPKQIIPQAQLTTN